jgi:hypothetical protein
VEELMGVAEFSLAGLTAMFLATKGLETAFRAAGDALLVEVRRGEKSFEQLINVQACVDVREREVAWQLIFLAKRLDRQVAIEAADFLFRMTKRVEYELP